MNQISIPLYRFFHVPLPCFVPGTKQKWWKVGIAQSNGALLRQAITSASWKHCLDQGLNVCPWWFRRFAVFVTFDSEVQRKVATAQQPPQFIPQKSRVQFSTKKLEYNSWNSRGFQDHPCGRGNDQQATRECCANISIRPNSKDACHSVKWTQFKWDMIYINITHLAKWIENYTSQSL